MTITITITYSGQMIDNLHTEDTLTQTCILKQSYKYILYQIKKRIQALICNVYSKNQHSTENIRIYF